MKNKKEIEKENRKKRYGYIVVKVDLSEPSSEDAVVVWDKVYLTVEAAKEACRCYLVRWYDPRLEEPSSLQWEDWSRNDTDLGQISSGRAEWKERDKEGKRWDLLVVRGFYFKIRRVQVEE